MSRGKPKRVTHRNRRRSGFHSIEWIRALNWFMRGWGRRRIAHLHSWKALGPSGQKAQLRISSICWKCGKRAQIDSWGDQQSRMAAEGVFHSDKPGMDFVPCTDLGKLHVASWFISEPFGNVKRQWGRSAHTSLLRHLTPVSILRSRTQIDYDLFISQ